MSKNIDCPSYEQFRGGFSWAMMAYYLENESLKNIISMSRAVVKFDPAQEGMEQGAAAAVKIIEELENKDQRIHNLSIHARRAHSHLSEALEHIPSEEQPDFHHRVTMWLQSHFKLMDRSK